MNDDNRIDKPKKPPPPPKAFGYGDYHKIEQTIEKMMITQLGAMQEKYTGKELMELFVPHDYRTALKTVYAIEEASQAKGEIWFDLVFGAMHSPVFEDPAAPTRISEATMRLYFSRDNTPDGFITPTPLFGTRQKPIRRSLASPSEELRRRFYDNCGLLLKLTAEWTMVRWVVDRLQNSLRTPQQMRYVWPAIYNIAQAAELNMNLSTTSARAAMNAVPAPDARPYLRETNDVVARSVLLGINTEYIERHNRKDIVVSDVKVDLSTVQHVRYQSHLV